jgi:hypothetical protein
VRGVLPTFFGIDLGGAFPSFPAFPLRCCTGCLPAGAFGLRALLSF